MLVNNLLTNFWRSESATGFELLPIGSDGASALPGGVGQVDQAAGLPSVDSNADRGTIHLRHGYYQCDSVVTRT